MQGDAIDQFIWGFQRSFRTSLELIVERSLESLGAPCEVTVFLIGTLRPGGEGHVLCIEPERGPLTPADFDGLAERAEELYTADPESHMSYGAKWIQEKKHQDARDRAAGRAMTQVLERTLGPSNRWTSGLPTAVEQHFVFPIIGVPAAVFDDAPSLRTETMFDGRIAVTRSLVEGAVSEALRVSTAAMREPNAGVNLAYDVDAADIVRAAGRLLTRSAVVLAGNDFHGELHDAITRISTARYERREGAGRVILAAQDSSFLHRKLALRDAVPIGDIRSARKILEMTATHGAAMHTDGTDVVGLSVLDGSYDADTESVYEIAVVGYGSWELSHDGVRLMTVQDGAPRLPAVPITSERFHDTVTRIFGAGSCDPAALWEATQAACRAKHGTMLVVSSDATGEAARLGKQCLPVEPVALDGELVERVTSIDGAVLVDPAGVCHAVGVIVDGMATDNGDRARGARYNSAVRYLASQEGTATVIVLVSEDGMVNVLPDLRARIDRADLETRVRELRAAAKLDPQHHERYHKAFDAVRARRFYLTPELCDEINALDADYDARRIASGGWSVVHSPLMPDPDMNETYFLPDLPGDA